MEIVTNKMVVSFSIPGEFKCGPVAAQLKRGSNHPEDRPMFTADLLSEYIKVFCG